MICTVSTQHSAAPGITFFLSLRNTSYPVVLSQSGGVDANSTSCWDSSNYWSLSRKLISWFLAFFLLSRGCSVFAAESPASAQAVAASSVPATAPSDEYDWKGDKVQLLVDVTKIKKSADESGDYFAPESTIFTVSNDDKKTNKLTVKFLNVKPGDGQNVHVEPTDELPLFSKIFAGLGWKYVTADKDRVASDGSQPVDTHGAYVLDKAAVENIPHTRYGWTFGALIVPFKYQLSDKSFGGSSTIGPYVGYRFQDNQGAVTPVVSAGWVNNIPVALANGGGTINRSGFSWAAGVIFSIDKGTGFQAGVLVGQDRLGSNAAAPYQYEGKYWLSLSVGYKFF
ncbi:hypothetical protein [Sideroxyarcus sp. TK5]